MTGKAILAVLALLLVNGIVVAQKGRSSAKKILLLKQNEIVPQEAHRIKRVAVGGDDGSAAYTYDDVIGKIEEIAAEWEANLVKIEEHAAEAGKCDRIVATLYDLDLPVVREEMNEELPATRGYTEGDFVWTKARKLEWRDFQGSIPHLSRTDLTVAATYCGFGYEMSYKGGDKPHISIKNRFYVNKSWGMPEFMNVRVLEHEQAHFDLCEIYTRKFRELAAKRIKNGVNYRKVVKETYDQVYSEYERMQERYDSETDHGNDKEAQKKWLDHIRERLSETDSWCEV